MKILFDYQIFEQQKVGGISRYFFELINQFQNNNELEWDLPIIYSGNEYLKELPQMKNQIKGNSDFYNNFLGGVNFKGKSKLFNLANKISLNKKIDANRAAAIQRLNAANFDIFHPSDYDNYYLDYIGNKPYVVTVYDMIHEIFPEYLSINSPTTKNKKNIFEKAAKIIAISENTKNDLVNILNINPEKIKVIYLANSLNPANPDLAQNKLPNLPKRYLLFVGSRTMYKNFYFFVQAILPVLEKDPSLNIVCTGSKINEDELLFFNRLGISNRIYQYFVDDNSLAYLYENALAFIFPSLYEGFGIPVLEAFSCNCPAVLSNTSSLPEIAEKAALYFEPKNAVSIRAAVEKVIYDNKLREEMKLKGKEQLKKFSWEKTANATVQVYKDVLAMSV
jgi:glycosyltransferase involved in cell wall biosynthesis